MVSADRTPDGHDVPSAGRRRARWMSVVNVPMRVVLAQRFATPLSNRLMLAYLTGRASGRHYRQPLSYVRDGDLLLTPGGGRWTYNVLDGRPVLLRLRGRDRTARPEFVRDPDRVEALLDAMTKASPSTARFIPLPRTPDGRLDRAALQRAVQHGFGIVCWHLVPASTGSAAAADPC